MKKGLSLLLVFMLAFSLTACSKGSDSSSPKVTDAQKSTVAPSSSDAAKPTATPAAPKDVTLKLGLPQGYDVTKKEIIDGFQAKFPNIKLVIDETPWNDFFLKITSQIASGNPPDIWFTENANVLGNGKRGIAEDLAPYIKRDLNQADFSKALLAAQTPDGHIWGVPHGINPVGLAYNKKLFTDANIPFPSKDWTYQDMLDAAKKLTKSTNGKTDVYGFGVTSSITQGLFPWSKIYGGGLLDASKTKAIFTDPKTVQGFEKWASVIKDGISPPFAVSNAAGGITSMFGKGNLAMYFMQYAEQNNMNKNFPNLDYDVQIMPKGYDGNRIVPYVTNSWLIYSKAKQEVKDAAWEFLKYYLSEQSQDILAQGSIELPVRISSTAKLDMTKNPKNKNAFVDGVAEAGATSDENASWSEWRSAADPIFFDMYKLNKPVAQGAQEMQDKVQAVLDKNK